MNQKILVFLLTFGVSCCALAKDSLNVSGVYPHLRMWNDEGECGTGAVVPWQGDLWIVTYAPHSPGGSDDKLYQVTPGLEQLIFKDSTGGTPANRMIHRESQQLFIGPYAIDAKKNIRVIPYDKMYGRPTGNARHLTDPKNKLYCASMEEGLYEIDVHTLDVTALIRDGHGAAPKALVNNTSLLGYHGKGLYSTQGRLVYANNGDKGPKVRVDPTVESGALAEWFGEGDWQLVRRNQFTEVTGPGGIYGNDNPDTDPVWSMGWDARSLIFALLENEKWHYYRLPKGSHSYDGAHGWNTEWPRIREIGEQDLLATMHGTFWRFPATFSRKKSAGIAPRSNYLKVIGDFCRWHDKVVLGCDDSAKSEFINTRPFKARHGAPKQSNSNLWFVEPERLDHLGPVIGRGSVWLRDAVDVDQTSDPYLFSGYDHRMLHLVHGAKKAVTFTLEVDRKGNDQWTELQRVSVPANQAVSHAFAADESGVWIRLRAETAAPQVTAHFQYRDRDTRSDEAPAMAAGIATPDAPAATIGLMRSLSYNRLGLVAAADNSGAGATYYEINSQMELVPVDNPQAAGELVKAVRQPDNTYQADEASLLLIEDGQRYRLPKNERYLVSVRAAASPAGSAGKTLADHLKKSLARGAAATVSSTHANFAAAHAVDGIINDDEKRWIAGEAGPKWIELDLGTPKSIHSVWVVTGWKQETQYAARNFDVQVKSKDGWTTLPQGKIRGNNAIEVEVRLIAPMPVQHLRVVSTDEDYFRIYEVAAFDKILDIARPPVGSFGPARICREVATERDLLNLHGTFYELPARNAQGLAKVRPVATHNLAIQDFCSHNGLLFFTGIDADTQGEHIFRSADGKAAVWAGVIDDLWKFGKPRGTGGPWKNTAVKAGEPSDPYLMTAYDQKQVELSATTAATIRLEVDVDGTGLWIPYQAFEVKPGPAVSHTFPEAFSAYWVRATSDSDTTATAWFVYE